MLLHGGIRKFPDNAPISTMPTIVRCLLIILRLKVVQFGHSSTANRLCIPIWRWNSTEKPLPGTNDALYSWIQSLIKLRKDMKPTHPEVALQLPSTMSGTNTGNISGKLANLDPLALRLQ